MSLDRLAHVSIRTSRLDETRRFYVDVLGLRVGERPPFDFAGHWLYLGERDVVHLVHFDPQNPGNLVAYLGDSPIDGVVGTGSIDHVAFAATDLAGLLARAAKHGVAVRQRTVPSLHLQQVFLEDPNGVTIELNFAADEASSMDRAL